MDMIKVIFAPAVRDVATASIHILTVIKSAGGMKVISYEANGVGVVVSCASNKQQKDALPQVAGLLLQVEGVLRVDYQGYLFPSPRSLIRGPA